MATLVYTDISKHQRYRLESTAALEQRLAALPIAQLIDEVKTQAGQADGDGTPEWLILVTGLEHWFQGKRDCQFNELSPLDQLICRRLLRLCNLLVLQQASGVQASEVALG